MKVDHALILAAGFGTRMGKIGQVLPKVLWPVWGVSLLELQIKYLEKLGINDIYINLHHQADNIETFLKRKKLSPHINLIKEKSILGVGGAIHNLASQKKISYTGNLLILNADQFCFFDKEKLADALNKIETYICSLFAIDVSQKYKYSEIQLNKKNELSAIIPYSETNAPRYTTYSGMGLINLEKLRPTPGPSSFFDSIANYKEIPTPFIKLSSNYEYWDFGTKERFYNHLLKLKKTESQFKFFLRDHGISAPKNLYFKNGNVEGISLDASPMINHPPYPFISFQNIIEKVQVYESLL